MNRIFSQLFAGCCIVLVLQLCPFGLKEWQLWVIILLLSLAWTFLSNPSKTRKQ